MTKRKETKQAHDPPPHLDAQAVAKWRELLPILEARGDIDQGTADALAAYAQVWSRWTTSESKLAEHGPVVKSPSGFPVQNPFLPVCNRALEQLRKWGAVLGLTPVAKARASGRSTTPAKLTADAPSPLKGLRLVK